VIRPGDRVFFEPGENHWHGAAPTRAGRPCALDQGRRELMRATVMYGAGDVRIEDVPDPSIEEPTDAIIRVVRACICGSDLWPYTSMVPSESGQSMGHEALVVVEEIDAEVRT